MSLLFCLRVTLLANELAAAVGVNIGDGGVIGTRRCQTRLVASVRRAACQWPVNASVVGPAARARKLTIRVGGNHCTAGFDAIGAVANHLLGADSTKASSALMKKTGNGAAEAAWARYEEADHRQRERRLDRNQIQTPGNEGASFNMVIPVRLSES